MHANPLVERTINSAGTKHSMGQIQDTNFHTEPARLITDTDFRMHKNVVTSPTPNHCS